MYAQRILIDMPIDHHTAPAIADVPLRGEVLVPGSEVLGIRCAGCRAVTPDPWIAGMQCAVGDNGNGLSQRVNGNVSASDIGEIFGGRAGSEPGSVENLGCYAASWIGWWPKRPSSSAALT
jgi:hypothetical protein